MRFIKTALRGVLLIEPELNTDDRGFFARTYDREAFLNEGLESDFVQHSISYNRVAGTFRGLHYQAAPREEVKLVRCTAGAIHDVVVDLHSTPSSDKRWASFELSARNRLSLYVPKGFAHGFMTLRDESEVEYLISTTYDAEMARGIRWNDPAFSIRWPGSPVAISERDAAFPNFVA